jgi:hypothetical protein
VQIKRKARNEKFELKIWQAAREPVRARRRPDGQKSFCAGKPVDRPGTAMDEAGAGMAEREFPQIPPGNVPAGTGTATDRPGTASDHAGTASAKREGLSF